MTVISVPTRLRVATLTLLVCIPLIAFEVAIANRSPIWRLPYRSMGYWSFAFALISIPLSIWMSAGKKWAFQIALVFASAWMIASAWTAISMKYPPLGFFTVFMLGLFTLEFYWLRHELQRSFFDPKISWYQGLPKPIPGLNCQMTAGEKIIDLRVSRMDSDGVFLFSTSDFNKNYSTLASLAGKRKLEMTFNFRDRQVVCYGALIVLIGNGTGAGAGVQFLNPSADLKKDVGDFVEVLRGQGYV